MSTAIWHPPFEFDGLCRICGELGVALVEGKHLSCVEPREVPTCDHCEDPVAICNERDELCPGRVCSLCGHVLTDDRECRSRECRCEDDSTREDDAR